MTPPATDTPSVRHVVGCMTGTSLDGLDCALVRITGTGLGMTAKFLGMVSRPFDDTVRATLRHLAEGNAAPPIDYMRAARMLGVLHADAVAALLDAHPIPDPRSPNPDFIVAHGQTIWHAPQDTLSWQLFDPWPLVRHLGIPVCYDLRQADLIAGGEGAPITPIADWVMYRSEDPVTVVLNLGGIANGTLLYEGQPGWTNGRDLCPCNLLIDGTVQRLYPERRYDDRGAIAASSCIDPRWRQDTTLRELFDWSGRSLGREQLIDGWFDRLWSVLQPDAVNQWSEPINERKDIVGLVTDAVAQRIGEWLREEDPNRVIFAGGGARNDWLVGQIGRYSKLGDTAVLSDDLGIPCEAREAMAFAVLGALSQDGVPITLPQVTGANASGGPGVAGCWVYP